MCLDGDEKLPVIVVKRWTLCSLPFYSVPEDRVVIKIKGTLWVSSSSNLLERNDVVGVKSRV